MLKSYIKTIFRSLLRETETTFINVVGLTLGITGSVVLFLITKESNSFDKYHSKADRIYRIISQSTDNGRINFTQAIPAVLPGAFANDFNEIEEVAFTSYRRGTLITVLQSNGTEKKYEEAKGTVFTEPSFFRIFDRKIIIGSAEKGLDDPNEAIISRKSALKYFGREDVLGRVIAHENIEYKITAVMEDYPNNTDLPFDLMLSYITVRKPMEDQGWSLSDENNCYFLLKPNELIDEVTAKIPAFVSKYFGDGDENANGKTFVIQPLAAIHSDMRAGNYNTRMPKQANYVLSIIAMFLIVTACINFINLTTAEAIKRTREVGIRKVLGSSRSQLIVQFIGEAFAVTLAATLISIGCTQIFLGFVNSLLDASLTLNLRSDFVAWAFLGILVIVVTLLSGVYPALIVSAFKPALALKNQISNKRSSNHTMRRVLVVAQFFISQLFIIGTITLTKQLNFFQKQDIGFRKEAIVIVPIPVGESSSRATGSKMRTLKNEILRLPGIEKASLNFAPPSHRAVMSSNFSVHDEQMTTQIKQVDGDYIDLYSIPLLAGEKLTDSDTVNGIVVNERFVQQAGFTSNSEIIGTAIDLWGSNFPVKGVVKDFNTTSLERAIEPVVLLNNISGYHSLSIKLSPVDIQGTLDRVKHLWEAAYPEYIFDYEFLDEQIRALYRGEQRISSLLTIFSSIAIVIGCLGLYGLVSFVNNQKTKEIGIRKVLGASIESIVLLFSKEFFALILAGFILSAPIAGFIMHKLLQEFAYKISLGPSIFLIGIAITFFIAFTTVGFRSIKAALINPSDALRTE